MNKQKGFVSLIAILIIVTLTIIYIVSILDSQYASSKKSSGELDLETTNITNAVQKTENLKNVLEGANKRLELEFEGL